ncbi:uncharacterized protein ZBAI_04819 [Zygosaccharomyces bailii ISA1307]|nr:uncharacterized protein ZBAI_04819 [Zygosaccharomyces bailii ISA1307]
MLIRLTDKSLQLVGCSAQKLSITLREVWNHGIAVVAAGACRAVEGTAKLQVFNDVFESLLDPRGVLSSAFHDKDISRKSQAISRSNGHDYKYGLLARKKTSIRGAFRASVQAFFCVKSLFLLP